MKKNELISDCKRILINTQRKKVQKIFYEDRINQDIVIEGITRDDISSFCNKMLERFKEYIEDE